MYIFLSEIHLQEEVENKKYLRITPEYFDKLFLLAKNHITKQTTNMTEASASKLKLATETCHVHSFLVLSS